MISGIFHGRIGTQEIIILFSILIPIVFIYALIRAFKKGYREGRK